MKATVFGWVSLSLLQFWSYQCRLNYSSHLLGKRGVRLPNFISVCMREYVVVVSIFTCLGVEGACALKLYLFRGGGCRALRNRTLSGVEGGFCFLGGRGCVALWNLTFFGVEGALHFGILRCSEWRGPWNFTFLRGIWCVALWNFTSFGVAPGGLGLWNFTFLGVEGALRFGTLPFSGWRVPCILESYVVRSGGGLGTLRFCGVYGALRFGTLRLSG